MNTKDVAVRGVAVRLDGSVVDTAVGAEPGVQAARIAAAVDLGPRPRPATQGLLLLDSDEPGVEDVRAVGTDWAAAVEALNCADRRRWQVVVDGEVALDLVDAGDAGLWSVGLTPDGTVWRPVDAEEIWSALLAVLSS